MFSVLGVGLDFFIQIIKFEEHCMYILKSVPLNVSFIAVPLNSIPSPLWMLLFTAAPLTLILANLELKVVKFKYVEKILWYIVYGHQRVVIQGWHLILVMELCRMAWIKHKALLIWEYLHHYLHRSKSHNIERLICLYKVFFHCFSKKVHEFGSSSVASVAGTFSSHSFPRDKANLQNRMETC